MQFNYSHRLMQPEGHLGALFSIYECILYMCVRAPARETLCCLLPALASFRQRSTCGPHADAFAGPHRPEGLSHGLRCRRHSHTQLGDVSCMEYIVTPHTGRRSRFSCIAKVTE